jgi:hypothetical protein
MGAIEIENDGDITVEKKARKLFLFKVLSK